MVENHFKYLFFQRNEIKICHAFHSVKPNTWENILGSITYISNATNERSTNFDFKIVEWNFALDPQLRLNLTILLIDIKEVLQTCQRGNFSIQNFPSHLNAFTFCGRHPVFTHYTSSPRVGLFTKFILDVRIYVVLQFLVMSRNVISNEAVGNIENIIYLHKIQTIPVKLITYHIQVVKFQRICIITRKRLIAQIKIFDGPSVKSKDMSIRKSRICGTTFQITVQVCHEVILKYRAEQLLHIQKYFLKENSFNCEIPGNQCNDIKICSLQFETLPRIHINFTVVSFVFKGF